MNRRDFLRSAGAVSASAAFSKIERLLAEDAASGGWRTFEVTTSVEILKHSGATRLWLPAALISETPFQKTLSNRFNADGGTAGIVENRADGLGIIAAEFPAGVKPILTLTSQIATKNYAVDFSVPGNATKADRAELEYFRRPTKMLPTDGIVKAMATDITSSAKTDLEKARAIYEWIVDNTFRDPKTRGCGVGNIRFMLESKDLGGKCADLNSLYVGLARAAGLPARDLYGIRIAKSELGYKSLGTSSENITKAQHCRAEVHVASYGWVPVDPADVRKVVLEEPPGNRSLDDPMVQKARQRLFGSWEMNWMAYNFAHDVALPESARASTRSRRERFRLRPDRSDIVPFGWFVADAYFCFVPADFPPRVEWRPLCAMSESAEIVKLFFGLPLPRKALLCTLQTDGAEDKAMPGGNLSADSGAKTRPGFGLTEPRQQND